jgi:23S rRNA (guanosine2251-2'-O)-methyltransferase
MSRPDFLVGVNALEAALRHDAERVLEVLVEQGQTNKRVKDVVDRAKEAGIAVHARPREFLDKATGGLRHQGVIARYERPQDLGDDDLEGLVAAAGSDALVLILDGVQDPHNLGACLRSAEAAGVTAVVVPKDRAVGITPTVRMAAAGAADRVPLVRVTNLKRCMEQLKTAGVWITGLAGEATQSLYAVDFKGPCALAVGGEGDGLRRLTRDTCDHLARIPMRGDAESLNVSVATGIGLFEILRQRGVTAGG